jgi:NitT/TauT family transport system permease protein
MSTRRQQLPFVDFTIPTERYHQLIGFTLILLIWEAVGQATPSYFLAPISDIIIAFVDLYVSGEIYGPLQQSLTQLGIGYALAILVALPIGMLMGMSDTIKYLLDTYVNVMFVTSVSSLLPFLIIVFGTGLNYRIAVVFLFAVFHMIINIQAGVNNIDNELIKTARAYGANRSFLYRKIIFPAALPLIVAGFRLGIGRSLKGMVVAELWIYSGVGELLRGYQQFRQVDYVLAIVITLMLMAVLSVRLLYYIEMKYAPWKTTEGT